MELPPTSPSSLASEPVLRDPWQPPDQIIPLNGPLERRKFPPLLMLFVVLIGGFILFQVLAAVSAIAIIFAQGASMDDLANAQQLMEDNMGPLLIGNTIGQFFGLALPVWMLVYLHTRYNLAFLRIRPVNWQMIGLSIVGLAALMPLTWWLGSINSKLPLPEWLEQLEQSQMDMIEQVISQDLGLVFLLFMMAVTPAICEEIMFRGYIQRQFERSIGVVGAIVVTGIIFGLYHLRLTQAIPLALIGIYLSYLTWRTGSLWPAVIVHFANNAFSIILGDYVARQPDMDMETLENVDVPIGIVLAAALVLAGIVYTMQKQAEQSESKVSGSELEA